MDVKTDMNDIIFEFSYITKLGEIDKAKTQINGKAFYSMLAGCNLKKRLIFLYDKTPYKSNIGRMNYDHGNMNINWTFAQNQLLTQNNSFFGQLNNDPSSSQCSNNNEMFNYQNDTSVNQSQNSSVAENRFFTNMSQNSIDTQQDYHSRLLNSNNLSFSYADI